jgi:hypothetical protein
MCYMSCLHLISYVQKFIEKQHKTHKTHNEYDTSLDNEVHPMWATSLGHDPKLDRFILLAVMMSLLYKLEGQSPFSMATTRDYNVIRNVYKLHKFSCS